MYERFYNLRERPFALSPDPEYLYPSRTHQEALSYLRYGIEGHAGFVVITGEIGSGKTTLLQAVLRGLDQETVVARLVNTMLEPRELIESILLDFGVQPSGVSKPAMLRDLSGFLVEQRMAGRLVLLVIDEAQNLSLSALEEVRMLSNLETEKSKLIDIVMVGQPNLRETLTSPELEQLRQRVTVSYHIEALDAYETAEYVNHRLQRAAISAPLEFPPEVTDLVYQHSHGIPRMINVIADAILLFGYGADSRMIDRALAEETLEELTSTGLLPTAAAQRAAAALPQPETAEYPLTERQFEPVRGAGLPVASTAAAARALDESALRAREAQLARRERQLDEQRRVLEEELRLLRPGGARRQIRDAESTAPPWPPVASEANHAQPRAVRYIPVSPAPSQDHPSIWRRIRRTLLGSPEPA